MHRAEPKVAQATDAALRSSHECSITLSIANGARNERQVESTDRTPSRMLCAEDAHAMLLLTQGPFKPKRIDTLEAGRLLRILGTKKGLSLFLTPRSHSDLFPESRRAHDSSISSIFPIPVEMNTPYEESKGQNGRFSPSHRGPFPKEVARSTVHAKDSGYLNAILCCRYRVANHVRACCFCVHSICLRIVRVWA